MSDILDICQFTHGNCTASVAALASAKINQLHGAESFLKR